MPNTREKLIEIMADINCNAEYCKDCEFGNDIDGCVRRQKEIIADHLIANGVTIQKWIPVTERLPEDVYGKDRGMIVVLVRTKSGNVSQCSRCAEYDCFTGATFSQVKWTKNGQFYWSKDKHVTHWMPLPEPPKEV